MSKNKLKWISVLVFSILSSSIFAQESNYFKERSSDLTEHFIFSDELVEKTLSARYDELTRSDGIAIINVTKGGSQFTRSLHSSGKVYFNISANDYLNSLKSKLLEDYPNVDEIVNVYTTKSASLNAFATVNNNIYVNVGLLARVENEAQLAYIISHEIMHIVNAHIIGQTLEVKSEKESFSKSDILMNGDLIELYRHSVSRDYETEADVDGLHLFLKQGYDAKEAVRALELLKEAGSLTVELPLSEEYLFADTTVFSLMNALRKDAKTTVKSKDQEVEDSTHPLISDRISNVRGLLKIDYSTHSGSSRYLVSEKDFKAIKDEANDLLQSYYAEEFNFISLFQLSAYKYHIENDHSEENLNYLCYAAQGMYVDHLNDFDYQQSARFNKTDSSIYYFLKGYEGPNIAAWSYSIVNQLNDAHKSDVIPLYREALLSNIIANDKASLNRICGDSSGIDFNNERYTVRDTSLNQVRFGVSTMVSMTPKQVRMFNNRGESEFTDGKVALISSNNIKLHIRPLKGQIDGNPDDMEKLDERTNKVWRNLQEDYDEVVSVIPNDVSFDNQQYETSKTLSNWTSSRLYYEGHEYVYFDQASIDRISETDNIRYTFSTINVEVKNFNFAKGGLFWFSWIPMPHYVPQMLANIILGGTRKHQLSLIFDVKTGRLAYWDSRTSLEPSTIAQLHMNYNNVIQNFLKK